VDLQRAFSEIAESASRVCDANVTVTVYQVDGDFLLLTAHHGSIPVGPIGPTYATQGGHGEGFVPRLGNRAAQPERVIDYRTKGISLCPTCFL
jgi:hypothetical protein